MPPDPALLCKPILVLHILALTRLLAAGAASAAPLTAIVENVDPNTPAIAAMDYLESGRTLELGSAGWIEIGYFASCTHERITGGVVRIGSERSEVSGGIVDRRQVECDKDTIVISEHLGAIAAGSAQRSAVGVAKSIAVVTEPELRLHSAAPLIIANGVGEVEISRRLDPSDRQTLKLEGAAGRGAYDFAQNDRALQRGAAYRAKFGGRTIAFRIDPDAVTGASEILGRLILFAPEAR